MGVGVGEWRVRVAGVGDLAGVVRVERGAATAPHWGVGEYERILRGEGAVRRCLLVADAGGTASDAFEAVAGAGGVVGFAVGVVVVGVGELESVAVEEAWQRRGVGEALCRAVLEWCRGEGAAEVELEVRAGSVGAQRLYGRVGFVEVGRRKGYYEEPAEDAVLMRARL